MRCTAKAKSTGDQCQRSARKGWTVCRVHGAGSADHPGGRPPSDNTVLRGVATKLSRARRMKATEDLKVALLRVVERHMDAVSSAYERRKRLMGSGKWKAEVDANSAQLRAMTALGRDLAAGVISFSKEDPEGMAALLKQPR